MQEKLPSIASETLAPGLVRLGPDAPMEHILAALWRDGAVIIECAVSAEVADRVALEMKPHLDTQQLEGDSTTDLRDSTHGGSRTKRVGGVVGRSQASWDMVGHPLLQQICSLVLGRQLLHMSKDELVHSFRNGSVHNLPQFKFQCHLHQLIQIWPGNRQAIFHEDLSWEFNFDAKMEPGVL